MHKIYHISRFTLQTGMYDVKAAANSMLIRICDPGMSHATPFSDFKKVVDMEFLDAEDSCGFAESDKFSMEQALFSAYSYIYSKECAGVKKFPMRFKNHTELLFALRSMNVKINEAHIATNTGFGELYSNF